MVDLHSLPSGSRPEKAIRNNGPDDLALQRYKLRELAEGWPCYRDACEWENFASIFHPDAYVYTTWTGRTPYRDFIQASQRGMDNGAFIMHRVHGSTTDINLQGTRAVTKMKAAITQRFDLDGVEADAESDCRFCFFWERDSTTGAWAARFVRHWYEKDKLIPVNPSRVPVLDDEKLKRYPIGYRYLAYCQETTMGVKVKLDMPGHRREGANDCGRAHDELYWQCKRWVEGGTVDL
ncbi:SnoaL-like domain-containing protein [Cladophialophora immunda]|nr:SnoaL-like domain-containing protein [Cladophialophora immunda]